MRRFWSSTFGLVALISALLALATLGIGLAAYGVTHEAIEAQLDQRVAIATRALLAEPGIDRLAAMTRAIERRERVAAEDGLGYLLVDAGGRRLAGRLDVTPPPPGFTESLPRGDGHQLQALTTSVDGGGRLVVATDRAALDIIDHQLLALFATAFGATLLLGVGGAWTVAAVTRARLRRIDATALAIIGGDLRQRVPTDGTGSEFDRVAATLNRMLDRIGALMDNLREVSSDVAHELRTPLTRLQNRLDDALRHAGPEREQAIVAASAQAQELLEIFAALLRISEVEAFGVRRHFRELALGVELGELFDTYKPDAENSGHQLVDAIDRSVRVFGDRQLLLQLVSNLLDNALRHTPTGTRIEIRLSGGAAGIHLVVADNGPGVTQADAAHVFTRFRRATTGSVRGHGLGLALVRAIALAHDGTVRLRDEAGFVVEVALSAKMATGSEREPLAGGAT